MSSQLQVSGEAKIRDIQGPVVANSGVITALDGAASQYVRGDGTLADFPTSSGGGSSVSYYLNSSVSQGTIGGVAYRELSKEPIIGAGTDIAISTTGYVASYLTDANDPDVILIPGGNFNCEFYFSVNNNSGNPFFYAELYKYDGTTFTLLGSSVGVPEYINQGTIIAPYYFAIPVATAALALTDRLAIRIYVNVDGRTVTLHTENGHLCQVVTTLSKGMVSLNNLTDQSQFITTGTSGTNFAIVSSGDTHTFNLPIASATNTGKLSSSDWSVFNAKQAALSFTAPLVNTSDTISIPAATSLVDGYLDNLDWVKFNTAYNRSLTSAAVTGTTTKTLTLNQQDGGTITASWTDDNTDAVTSVFGRTGAVVATSGDYNTSQVTENTNLYYTDARSRAALSFASGSGAYNSTTGVITIPTNNNQITNGSNFITLASLSGGVGISYNNTTGVITNSAPDQTVSLTNGAGISISGTYPSFTIASTITQYTDALARAAISLTTTGTSGAATYNSTTGVFNIPNYGSALSGYLPLTGGTLSTTNSTETLRINNSGSGYALYVQTNSYFQGDLTLQGSLKSAFHTFILPNASGTLALTSNLSAYLPLTGGTLTGALSGTSATFSSSVTVNGDNSIFTGGTANNFNTFPLGIANTKNLIFVSPAAAQAGGRNWSGGIGANASEDVFLGAFNNLSFGAGSLATRMTILGSNGNVLIGTTTDAGYKLDVNGTGRFSGALTGTSAIFNLGATTAFEINSVTGYNSSVNYLVNGTSYFTAQVLGDASNLGDYRVYSYSAGEVFKLKYATGAATFSSSVTTNGSITTSISSNSGSGSSYPLTTISNTLATQGDGSSTFNFSGLLVQSGNGAVQFYHATSYASGTWEPQALLNVATNHPLIIRTNNTERLIITNNGNVGINTGATNAGYKLDVNGTGRFTGNLNYNSGSAIYPRTTSVTNWYLQKHNSAIDRIDNAVGNNNAYTFGIDSGGTYTPNIFLYSGGSATFSDTITSTGNATTSTAHIFNNPSGSTGTAQYYADFKAGATLIARILRGNGASGYEGNGLNIDNFAGMQININTLGGSGGTFNVIGGAATFSSSVTASKGTFNGSTSEPITFERIISGSSIRRYSLAISGAGNFSLYDATADADRFIIASNGAATFFATGAASYGTINLVSSDSFIRLNTTGGTADKRKWDIRAISASGSEALEFRTINDANNSFSTKVWFAHSGNVGIGTSAPLSKMQIRDGNLGIYVTQGSGGALGGQIYLGDVNFDNGSYYNSAPGIGAAYNGFQGVDGDLAFYAYAGTMNSRTERMRIAGNSGFVGIGTTSPSNILTVQANDTFNQDASGQLVLRGASNTAKCTRIGFDTTNNYGYVQSIEAGVSTRPFVLQPFGGNVGIGTTNPQGGGGASDRTLSINSGSGAASFLTGLVGDVKYSTLFTSSSIFVLETNAAIPLAFNTNGNERMRLTSSGNILINTQSENSYGSARSIQINGSSGSLLETRYNGTSGVRVGSGSDHSYMHEPRNVEMRFATSDSTRFYIYGNGNYSFTGSNVSDRRAKDNIATLELTATDKIMQLEAKSYNMKNNPSQKRYGFIAQDVKQVVADLVSGNDTDGYLGLDYDGLLTIAIKAIQEQQKQIEILKQKIYEN